MYHEKKLTVDQKVKSAGFWEIYLLKNETLCRNCLSGVSHILGIVFNHFDSFSYLKFVKIYLSPLIFYCFFSQFSRATFISPTTRRLFMLPCF